MDNCRKHGKVGYDIYNQFVINRSIQSGIQGPEHPHPGLPYKAIGFPRTAYLPNNAKGKKVNKIPCLTHITFRSRSTK